MQKNVKVESQGMHSHQYIFDGMIFYASAYHISLFYDFLYLNALLEPEDLETKENLLNEGYTAFSDLATKSLNCQARSAAIFVGLAKAGRIGEVKGYGSYLRLFRTKANGEAIGPELYEKVQLLHKNKIRLLSSAVPCKYYRHAVEKYYVENCSSLTNRKAADNFLDLRCKSCCEY